MLSGAVFLRSPIRWTEKHTVLLLVSWLALNTLGRLPIWDFTDPLAFLVTDGDWVLVDLVHYLLAAVIVFAVAFRALPAASWPREWLLAFVPFVAWAMASCWWSQTPRYSWSEWGYEVFLAPAALMVGYLAGGRLSSGNGRGVFFAILGTAVWMVAHDPRSLPNRYLDPILFGNWLAYVAPVVIAAALYAQTRVSRVLAFASLAVVFGLAVPVQSRALWLVLLVFIASSSIFLFCLVPRGLTTYRLGVLGSSGMVAAVGYLLTAAHKPASWLAPVVQSDSWWRAFINTERYQIFAFWIEQGMASWFHGVGYGWKLPMLTYGKAKPDTLVDIMVTHGHNVMINMFLQLGVVGLLLFLLPVALVCWRLVRVLRRPWFLESWSGQAAALALTLLVIALVVKNFPDDGHRDGNILLYWLLVGAVAAFLDHIEKGHACHLRTLRR